MTDPLGRHWHQPPRESILLDATHALMTDSTFQQLREYSTTIPTGPPASFSAAAARDRRFLLDVVRTLLFDLENYPPLPEGDVTELSAVKTERDQLRKGLQRFKQVVELVQCNLRAKRGYSTPPPAGCIDWFVETALEHCPAQWQSPPSELETPVGMRMRVEQLASALQSLIRGYVSTLESARDRILAHGGQCDPVDVMERADPHLKAARSALATAADKRDIVAVDHEGKPVFELCDGRRVPP